MVWISVGYLMGYFMGAIIVSFPGDMKFYEYVYWEFNGIKKQPSYGDVIFMGFMEETNRQQWDVNGNIMRIQWDIGYHQQYDILGLCKYGYLAPKFCGPFGLNSWFVPGIRHLPHSLFSSTGHRPRFFHQEYCSKQQGLVNVPFWGHWTSPYSSHYRPYT